LVHTGMLTRLASCFNAGLQVESLFVDARLTEGYNYADTVGV
jgi:hypothetical protein